MAGSALFLFTTLLLPEFQKNINNLVETLFAKLGIPPIRTCSKIIIITMIIPKGDDETNHEIVLLLN